MFDLDGNILTSLKNSFNQSFAQGAGNTNSRKASEYSQSIVANLNGPQGLISPMINLKKLGEDQSVKVTSSS